MVREIMMDILVFLSKYKIPAEYDMVRASYSIETDMRVSELTRNYFTPLVNAGFIVLWSIRNEKYKPEDGACIEPIYKTLCKLSDKGREWMKKGGIGTMWHGLV